MNQHSPAENISPESSSVAPRAAGRLAWYLQRLGGMSAGEVVHRLHELTRRKLSARRAHDWADFECGDGPVPALPLPDHFENCPEALLAQWREVADLALASKLPLLGQTWPARRTPGDWHRDPVTGELWPADIFCFKVPFRHMHGFGDPKYMWERNRLQYLQPIAALARKTGDAGLARFCVDEIESWMEGNRPFNGLAWATGVEVALRIATLLTVASFLPPESLSTQSGRRLRACLAAHGYWLARFPSRYSSANNHLIAEAAGLFLLGSLAGDFQHAGAWAKEGREILVAEIEKQIHLDGVGAEQSPTYSAFTLEWYLLAGWLADHMGAPFPAKVHNRMALAAGHFHWLLDANGNHPRIGDDDEGRVLYSAAGGEDRYVASVAGAMAVFLKRPDLAPNGCGAHLRNLYCGFPGAGSSPHGQKSFDSGGYTILREAVAGRDMLLAMDHGPLGFLSIAAHGHADALAVWLHVDGEPVLVDAGTYLYHSGKDWRDHFRGTSAHNTLTLNGADTSRMAGAFNWSHKASAWRERGTHDPIEAAHDGYRKSFGVVHRRSIVKADAGFTVRDSLEGNSKRPLDVEIGFLVHPALDVRMAGDSVRVLRDGSPLMDVSGSAVLDVTIQRGSEPVRAGWYSPRFGEKVPASRIVFSRRCHAPAAFEITFQLAKSGQ